MKVNAQKPSCKLASCHGRQLRCRGCQYVLELLSSRWELVWPVWEHFAQQQQ